VPPVQATVVADNVGASILLNTNSGSSSGADLTPASSVPSKDVARRADNPDGVISANTDVACMAWSSSPINGSQGEALSTVDAAADDSSCPSSAGDGLSVGATASSGGCSPSHSHAWGCSDGRASNSNRSSSALVNLSEILRLFVARLQGVNSHCEHSER